MAAFDQHANYDCPAPSYEEGSHSDSSVITISPDEAETQELDVNVATVSQAPWDDETWDLLTQAQNRCMLPCLPF